MFKGTSVAGLSAHFYEEMVELSKKLEKLIVVVASGEGQASGLSNLEVVEVPAWHVKRI